LGPLPVNALAGILRAIQSVAFAEEGSEPPQKEKKKKEKVPRHNYRFS